MKLCPVRVGLLLALSSGPQIFAQTPAPTFDVASVKPNKSGDGGTRIMFQPGGRFVATGITLKMLIRISYGVQDFQITQGPAWINSDKYDIEARGAAPDMGAMRNMTEEQRKAANEVRKQMIQALLADRFKLTLHKESKDAPIYALVVAKSGLKIKELPPEVKPAPGEEPKGPPDKPDPDHPRRGGMRMGRGELKGEGIKLSFLADALSDQVGRKVFDKTGLTGEYNFEMKWTPDESQGQGFKGPGDAPPPDVNGPTIFTAIQEQLGLKLDPQKGPVDFLVIDHAEKASEN
jgi:bla regulator protein blaR1